jgi:hypothetical protein
MVRKRWMRWRGEKGEEYPEEAEGGEGARGEGSPAEGEIVAKQAAPPTQLLRYSYLEQTTRNSN